MGMECMYLDQSYFHEYEEFWQASFTIGIADKWYEPNGMIVNPHKHQAMVLDVSSNNS